MERKFNSLTEAQACQKWWEEKLIDEEGRTPQFRFQRFMEEVREFEEAINSLDGSFDRNLEAGLELADIFIIGFSLADALGFDIERLVFKKLERNHHKYNVEKARQLREQGYSWQEVMRVMKGEWKGKRKI